MFKTVQSIMRSARTCQATALRLSLLYYRFDDDDDVDDEEEDDGDDDRW